MSYNVEDPRTWPTFKPTIIAHDVGYRRDRSTAVVGGNSPYGHRVLGIGEASELPQGLFGSARASALAAIDRQYASNALIVADISFDPTYAEVLLATFGPRVIGLHIGPHGEGMNAELRPVNGGQMPVYTVGRSSLLELLHSELQSDRVKFADNEMMRRAYEQLANLETEYRESGVLYRCSAGHHDDLGMSCAMLAWAARHSHLPLWMRNLPAAQRPRKRRQSFGWEAFT